MPARLPASSPSPTPSEPTRTRAGFSTLTSSAFLPAESLLNDIGGSPTRSSAVEDEYKVVMLSSLSGTKDDRTFKLGSIRGALLPLPLYSIPVL